MKIGVDIGGSHMAVGLIDNEKILLKEEKDFLEEERANIKETIEENLVKNIKKILDTAKLSINEIEKIRNWSSSVE